MVNHKGVKLCKAKGQIYRKQNSKCTGVKNRIYTQCRTFRFFPASSPIPNAVAATQIMFNCSTFYFIMASRARQATREFTKPRRQRQRQRHQTKGLTELNNGCARAFWILNPLQINNVKWLNSALSGKRGTRGLDFKIFISYLSLCFALCFEIEYGGIGRLNINSFFTWRCPRRRRLGFVNSLLWSWRQRRALFEFIRDITRGKSWKI